MILPHPPTLVLASHNAHKVTELLSALAAQHLSSVSVITRPDVPDIDETGTTFAENALLKARAFAQITQLPALSDDSGLCVDALGGAPGVYSARFSGVHGPGAVAANNALLLQKLAGLPPEQRRAHFHCTLAFALPLPSPEAAHQLLSSLPSLPREVAHGVTVLQEIQDATLCVLFEGTSHGTILEAPLGAGGFGYDPLFFSDDLNTTFAQASQADKNSVSHRGRAMHLFAQWLALV